MDETDDIAAGYLPLEDCDWRTPYSLRPDAYRDPRSGVTEGRWRAANVRRMAGEAMADIAADLGVSENRAAIGLRDRFGLKRDHAGAVHRPRGRAALPASPRDRMERPELALPVDLSDRAWTVDMVEAEIEAATRRGALGPAVAWSRMLGEFARGVWKVAAIPHPGREAAVPPHEGEGDGAARPALKLHAHQTPPAEALDGSEWTTWLLLGGRGAGKTLAGASWLADQAEKLGEGGRLALVGATLHDVREVMIEGPSGLKSLGRWWKDGVWAGPRYEPSRRRLIFPDQAVAYAFSAEDADGLRGPQFAAAWADEVCAWKTDAALAMVRLGLRLPGAEGAPPRLVLTTTPRATRALTRLLDEPGLARTDAGTAANAAHLAPGFVAGLRRLYGGTRLEAQEIEGQVVDLGGALFTAEMMRACRADAGSAPVLERVVVGVDPTASEDGAACGIVVAGRAGEVCWVLADRTAAGLSPGGWGKRVAETAETWRAHAVVAEVNQGGDMVGSVLKTAGCAAPIVQVRATKGKVLRAEPVAALYEQGRVRHAGTGLARLEEALMGLGAAGAAKAGLDRADALVWAVTELMLGDAPGRPGVRIL